MREQRKVLHWLLSVIIGLLLAKYCPEIGTFAVIIAGGFLFLLTGLLIAIFIKQAWEGIFTGVDRPCGRRRDHGARDGVALVLNLGRRCNLGSTVDALQPQRRANRLCRSRRQRRLASSRYRCLPHARLAPLPEIHCDFEAAIATELQIAALLLTAGENFRPTLASSSRFPRTRLQRGASVWPDQPTSEHPSPWPIACAHAMRDLSLPKPPGKRILPTITGNRWTVGLNRPSGRLPLS
jgi:hypothetical protein